MVICILAFAKAKVQIISEYFLSKKATKIDEIFTVDLTVRSKCEFYGEDFVKFCALLRKHEVYPSEDDLTNSNSFEIKNQVV